MKYRLEFLNEVGDWEDVFGFPVKKEKADYFAKLFLVNDPNCQLVILPA